MNAYTAGRLTPQLIISQLYGYIFCMIISGALLGQPLYGGALYLCGRAVVEIVLVNEKKERQYIPGYARRAGMVLSAVLVLISLALSGIYPARIENPSIWIVFAVTMLCLCADCAVIWCAGRFAERNGGTRFLTTRSLAALTLPIVILFVILGYNLGWRKGFLLTAVFLICALARAWALIRSAEPGGTDEPRTRAETDGNDIRSVRMVRSFGWLSLLMITAVEMTLSVMFALLATETENLLPVVAVGIGCSIAGMETGGILLKKSRNEKDPVWLFGSGTVLWLAGIVLCGFILRRKAHGIEEIYLCLALASSGGALCLHGLRKTEEFLPEIARLTDKRFPGGYGPYRKAYFRFSALLGDVLALILLCFSGPLTGRPFLFGAGESIRFRPVMMLPVAAIILGTLLSVVYLPISARYYRKLKWFRELGRDGENNPALESQLTRVVTGPYRQPLVSSFLIRLVRRVYRFTVKNPEKIEEDPRNPLVFICNHGEIHGPIACKLFIPVQVRSWSINRMMFDRKKVEAYIYENTFSKISTIPGFLRKFAAWFFGGLSVTVMRQLEAIPVYRDEPARLRETLRDSVEALESGDNLLIFPEMPKDRYAERGIKEISPGYVMLALAYWRKTKKRLRFLPVYADREARTLAFGDIITYNPEEPFSSEQQRILAETDRQINGLAGTEPELTTA